ncbi:MAG: hypothetical protein AB8C02_19210 [Halioglobus sp.]
MASKSHAIVDHRSAVHNAFVRCPEAGDEGGVRRIEEAAAARS